MVDGWNFVMPSGNFLGEMKSVLWAVDSSREENGSFFRVWAVVGLEMQAKLPMCVCACTSTCECIPPSPPPLSSLSPFLLIPPCVCVCVCVW